MADRTPNLLDPLLDRQSRAWLSGSRVSVEEVLAGSAIHNDPEAQLDLIYNEIVLREELGEHPRADEYLARYPHLRDDLELHFEVHRALGEAVLNDTPRLQGNETLPDVPGTGRAGLSQPPGYELIEVLGRGGMGVVYKARHRGLRRLVALKMFEPGRLPSPREVARFRTEAEAIARLQHPNIVQIFEIGEWDGLPFLALELAERGTLAQRLQRLPFAPRAAAELVAALARAVQHAHDHRIVHRDVKPANVLFAADGTPKLTDFGLAKVLEPDAVRDTTRTGEPLGTPRYMAPEQAAGRPDAVGPATDVYALGTLLYECLTGQVPFVSTSVVETLQCIQFEEPTSPRRVQPAVPRDLATVCLNCLHKEPGRRYATAQALADDLQRFISGEPVRARATPQWERGWKWCRRRPAAAALVAVTLLLAGGGAAAAGIWNHKERQRIASARERVEVLVTEGQAALARDDEAAAEARFREAWELVQGEPALHDARTGVAGWLDHARRAGNKYRWQQRVPPPEYPERRDAAFFRGLLLDPDRGRALGAARAALAAALELAAPNDPERDALAVLAADLALAESDPAGALARLEGAAGAASRLVHARRAECLDLLGRPAEAAEARRHADRFPPAELTARFFAGMARARGRDFAAAAGEFEAVLDAEPEHFAARLFLAVCALERERFGEAKVGLTACIAQRPYCPWGYEFRGRCAERAGDAPAARRDRDRAAQLRLEYPNR